jgi:prepilin peptidase CpaA
MTAKPFFPDAFTGGVFFFLLVIGLAVAAYIDFRTFRIPKWVTLSLLGLGLVVNTVRGAWLGSLGKNVWVLGDGSATTGALDGFLFALAGAAFAFALYFVMWNLGVVKGGDVKLCTAIGAWLGWLNMVLFLFVSVAVLLVWAILWAASGGMGPKSFARRMEKIKQNAGMTSEAEIRKFARRGLSFSFPAAVAAALVMLWAFRTDLQLVEVKSPSNQGSAHAPVHVAAR